MRFITYLINGISLGSIYAIIALGYTMVYGIAKMLNFAHGDVIMIGCYVVFMTMSGMNMNPLLSVILAVVVCTVLGVFCGSTAEYQDWRNYHNRCYGSGSPGMYCYHDWPDDFY